MDTASVADSEADDRKEVDQTLLLRDDALSTPATPLTKAPFREVFHIDDDGDTDMGNSSENGVVDVHSDKGTPDRSTKDDDMEVDSFKELSLHPKDGEEEELKDEPPVTTPPKSPDIETGDLPVEDPEVEEPEQPVDPEIVPMSAADALKAAASRVQDR